MEECKRFITFVRKLLIFVSNDIVLLLLKEENVNPRNAI